MLALTIRISSLFCSINLLWQNKYTVCIGMTDMDLQGSESSDSIPVYTIKYKLVITNYLWRPVLLLLFVSAICLMANMCVFNNNVIIVTAIILIILMCHCQRILCFRCFVCLQAFVISRHRRSSRLLQYLQSGQPWQCCRQVATGSLSLLPQGSHHTRWHEKGPKNWR